MVNSDHTHGTDIPPIAVAAGAKIIEKHFTDNPKLRESDNFFSITSSELKEIKFKIKKVEEYIYSPDFENNDPEKFMRSFRKIIKLRKFISEQAVVEKMVGEIFLGF